MHLTLGNFFYAVEPEFYNGRGWSDEYSPGNKYAPCIIERINHVQVTISTSEVMIFGGSLINGTELNSVAKYDFRTNSWTHLAPLTDSQRSYV